MEYNNEDMKQLVDISGPLELIIEGGFRNIKLRREIFERQYRLGNETDVWIRKNIKNNIWKEMMKIKDEFLEVLYN